MMKGKIILNPYAGVFLPGTGASMEMHLNGGSLPGPL